MSSQSPNTETGAVMAPVSTRLGRREFDVAVIGGGPAGLSAALVLGRARRSVAVIDAGTPRNARASEMHGFLSRDGMPPAELLAVARSEIGRYGVDPIDDLVTHAHVDEHWTLSLGSRRSISARQVLIATGASDELPDIAGIAERWGRDVLHCPYCHGWEVRDEPLGVLGTNGGSVGHAVLIRQWSPDVVYFPHDVAPTDDEERLLRSRGIEIVSGRVESLVVTNDRLEGIRLVDGRYVARAAIFIRTTNTTHGELIRQLGCATDDDGFVRADANGRTDIDTVWAAGNVVDPRLSVIAAAGAAAMTAMAINAALVASDVAHER